MTTAPQLSHRAGGCNLGLPGHMWLLILFTPAPCEIIMNVTEQTDGQMDEGKEKKNTNKFMTNIWLNCTVENRAEN